MKVSVYPLGAGQDVGRSCVLVTLSGIPSSSSSSASSSSSSSSSSSVTLMFDCGLHMGHTHASTRRYPDFARISPSLNISRVVDAVVISHFHLDHIGALPFLTEHTNYSGPVFMTSPTRAIASIMLEDYRRVISSASRNNNNNDGNDNENDAASGKSDVTIPESSFYDDTTVKRCLRKVTTVALNETIQVPLQRGQKGTLKLTAHYAGHVLGAAMFHASYQAPGMADPVTCVYTGDYNTRSDRHLGPAVLPQGLKPDVLITESTYADTVRDAKRGREREFLNAVHDTLVHHGGKVLIPVFALGRAQELCILLDEFWERLGWRSAATPGPPIFCTAGMAASANQYYDLYARWMNERRQAKAATHGAALGLGQVRVWERGMERRADLGPCVLLATPGMLHGGTSLDVFTAWCGDPRNLVVLPGYCVSGSVGSRLRESPRGVLRRVDVSMRQGAGSSSTAIDVRCAVRHLSFSAHADARGILGLIKQAEPRHVVLVHGEKTKMARLSTEIANVFGTPCYYPANHTLTVLESSCTIPVRMSAAVLREGRWRKSREGDDATMAMDDDDDDDDACAKRARTYAHADDSVLQGALVLEKNANARLVTASEALAGAGIVPHQVSCEVALSEDDGKRLLGVAYDILCRLTGTDADDGGARRGDLYASARSVHVRRVPADGTVRVSWLVDDAPLARTVLDALKG